MPSGYVSEFWETVPELMERFGNFAFDGVVSRDALDDQTRMTAILAALIGCQGIDECRAMVPAALNFGAAPVEVEEIPYQAVAYLGIGRVFPFLKAASEVLADRGVALPLAPQTGATAKNRLEKGEQAQVDIFGEKMRGFSNSGDVETRHIPKRNCWLAERLQNDFL